MMTSAATTDLGHFDRRTLIVFLSIDLALIAISISFGLMIVMERVTVWPDLFNVARDWSLGEMFNYLKWLLLIAILFRSYLQDRLLLLLMMCLFLLLVLGDDMLLLHERGGPILVIWTSLHKAIGPVAFQIGELAIWGLLGAVGAVFLYIGWRAADQSLRRKVMPMAWLFGGVIFCAVVLDVVHGLMPDNTVLGGVFLILEDGGEMLFISAMLSYAVGTFGKVASHRSAYRNA